MERKLVDDYAKFADDEYTSGSISKEVYFKVCTTLASEYLKDFGDVEACLVMLAKVEPGYYLTQCVKDMHTDSLYATILTEFVGHLARWGVLDLPVRPNQPDAEA